MSPATSVEKPWSLTSQEVLKELEVSSDKGLNTEEARKRRALYGRNRLQETKSRSIWMVFIGQFRNLIVGLLVVAAALSFLFHEWMEGSAIIVVIGINAAIGFITELRAVRSMEALRRLGSVSTKVRRNRMVQEILAEELVPGDMVILEGGDIVTADLRLSTASRLQADESMLTGEALPVGKDVERIDEEIPLAERFNMLFKGTAVTRGTGEGIVVATGMRTELGQITSLVEEAEEEVTPLEKRLDLLGRKLIWVTIVIAALVAISGILTGKEIFLMIETSIALAVATVPEGLPIVATIALARGMLRMAKRNALINRLSAVETLGATTIICTDKTGTLTENKMTVTQLVLNSGEIEIGGSGESDFVRNGKPLNPLEHNVLRKAIEIGVLCNNASLKSEGSEGEGVGDPLEVALLNVGARAGIHRGQLIPSMPEEREEAFDSEVKMMATFHRIDDTYSVAVKGAPEFVLECCSSIMVDDRVQILGREDREGFLQKNHHMAEEGLRVLAFAMKRVDNLDSSPYEELTFVALVGLEDPPRRDVRQAIESCQDAGIRVIMVTGDQAVTARNVALEVGLIDEKEAKVITGNELKDLDILSEKEKQLILKAPIFARVSPRQKLDLIEIHQENGSVVAMTGDGVNDAPALKKADIGVAMGLRGTQVAREAADMILRDDSFSTIVAAVEQGRIIFDDIKKVVLFLLSCNLSEIMVIFIATVLNVPLPILPLQILFLNLVTDIFPALALGTGKGDPTVMTRAPRDPKEPILTRDNWILISGYGLVITVSVLASLAMAKFWLGLDNGQVVTISFLTLAFAQLWHVFNMRDRASGFLRNEVTRNPFIWGSIALCGGLLVTAVYVPGLASVLRTTDPGIEGWILIISMSSVVYVLGQIHKFVRD